MRQIPAERFFVASMNGGVEKWRSEGRDVRPIREEERRVGKF